MLETLIDTWGDGAVLAMAGALVGVIFGAAAQHSRFCLRSASVEVAGGAFGPRLSIWIIAFCASVLSVQAAIASGFSTSRRPPSSPRPAASPARSSAG